FPDPAHRRFEKWELEDYSIHKQYAENNTDRTCMKTDLPGDIPNIWGWLDTATYRGQRDFRGRMVEIWGGTLANHDVIEMGCFVSDIHRPAGIYLNTTTRNT